jgi:hypothetical protein
VQWVICQYIIRSHLNISRRIANECLLELATVDYLQKLFTNEYIISDNGLSIDLFPVGIITAKTVININKLHDNIELQFRALEIE